MTSREMQMLVQPGDDAHFSVHIEPEGMEYALPPHEKVLLTFISPDSGTQYLDVSYYADASMIWRPADTEVWATLADGPYEQIAGWVDNLPPWLDSASDIAGRQPPWIWPPPKQ
jgi:hypothetical protein